MTQHIRRYLGIGLTIIVSTAFFMLLFFFDNRYQNQAKQPVNGVLSLSAEELNDEPLRFLYEGWLFYQEELLTPEDLTEGFPEGGAAVNLGEKHFTHENAPTPQGCGTYVLQLYLPEEYGTYAIDLPEVYSSCRVFIDNEEVLTLGTPDKENYQGLAAYRALHFQHEGAEPVTLIINVSNYSYYKGGMLTPPAFGTAMSVDYTRGVRLGVALIVLMLTMLAGSFGTVTWLAYRKDNIVGYMGAFSLVSVGYMCYFIFYSVFTIPILPWFIIPTVCRYIAMAIAVIAAGDINRIPEKITLPVKVVMYIIVVLAAIREILAQRSGTAMGEAFDILRCAFHIMAGAYIMIVTIAGRTKNAFDEAQPYAYATLFYGCSCILEIALTLYSPNIAGWFTEWGCVVLSITSGAMVIVNLFRRYTLGIATAARERQMARQLAMQREYSEEIREYSENNRRLIHDFRQHIRVISSMTENLDCPELKAYLDDIEVDTHSVPRLENVGFCDNAAVDALMRYYYTVMCDKGIKNDISITVPQGKAISDLQLCSVLGNLVENAIEACEKCSGERRIKLTTKLMGNSLFMMLSNTYNGKISTSRGRVLSSKAGKARYGIGLKSCRRIIEDVGGTFEVTMKDNIFRVGITIPVAKAEEAERPPEITVNAE